MAGELFQSISGKYSYDGHDVTLENCLGYIYDGTALVNGKIRGKDLELEASLTDISMERMLPGRGIEGSLSLLGHVRGTVDSPVFDGMASTREITMAEIPSGTYRPAFITKTALFLWMKVLSARRRELLPGKAAITPIPAP